jgi:DNA-binding winged helix-turn-helix (wHTH) protein
MTFQFGDFRVDESTRQLLRGEVEVHLSPKAFDLLVLLIQSRPRALSKADLHAKVWPRTFVSDASLAMLVAEVRAALGESAREPRFVRTVHRHGYAFQSSAAELPVPAAETVRRSNYWLVDASRSVCLAAGENIIGRDPGARLWLDSPSASRRHARITIAGNSATLEDLESKNGTQVNGRPVSAPVVLADHDEVSFGSVVFTVRVWRSDVSTKSGTDQ